MNLEPKLVKWAKEITEILLWLTLSSYVVKIFTLYLPFLQLVTNSEIDAANSLLSLIAVQLIGTIHGLQKLFILLLTDNTQLMKLNLVFLTTWIPSATCQLASISLSLKPLIVTSRSLDVRTTQPPRPILT